MDGQRFDELARRLGSGLSRRQVLRGLLGGGAAVTAATVFGKDAFAQGGEGDPCDDNEDCLNGLTCSANDTCQCNPSTATSTCPAGTHHVGLTKFLNGQCCNGNGNCCSNDCGPDGYCIPTASTCSEEGVECGAGCCEGLQCCNGFCIDESACCDSGDCTATGACLDGTCVNGTCFYDPNEDNCPPVSCARVSCSEIGECGAVSLCPPAGPGTYLCCPVGPGLDYCYGTSDVAEFECCYDEDCAVGPAGETCLVGVCDDGFCRQSPEDSLCDKDECCCEDGSCSDKCCEPSTCDDDKDCPKGSICCANYCREIECCIDDYPERDPNERCPGKCTCFEGLCVDEKQNHCAVCHSDKECGKDECCCKDGTCSADCCEKPEKPEKPETTTPAPIDTLPSTGAGPGEGSGGWIAGAALAAGAAALLGTKMVRDGISLADDEQR